MGNSEYFVRDLIISDEYDVIDSDATIEAAAIKMKKEAVPDLVVLNSATKKVMGVIGDFDIVQEIVAEGKNAKSEKVTTAMYTIEPVTNNTSVKDAFERMQKLNVNVVPVIEKEKLIGVASLHDCWSFISTPDVDEIGLIAVSNPRNVEFWIAGVCSILAFVLGIIFPLAGIYGYFTGSPSDLLEFFGKFEINGGNITFYLFSAHGTEFFADYTDVYARQGASWAGIYICSLALVIFGVLGIFSIIYTSYSDMRNVRTTIITRKILPYVLVGVMILEWIILADALSAGNATVQVDVLGLVMSILSMILLLVAINRDYIVRQELAPKEI